MAGLGSAAGFLDRLYTPDQSTRNRQLIKPKRLKPGDTVALTAPAGILYDESEFDRMKTDLEGFGFNVVFGEFVRERYGYFAGRDYQRALDLNRFFADPAIDGIISVRGGWGCSRILPYLDFERISENPKVYCGFSDNTTLHLAFLAYSGLVSFHGPNGASEWNEFTRNSFRKVVMDGIPAEYISSSRVDTLFAGMAEGPLTGGNLSILVTSLGTPYEPDPTGAILFIEDIGEEPYKVDRMLTHLARAGFLDKISGFIFGQCTDCKPDGSRGFTMKEVIQQHILPLEIPAVIGMDIGHDADNFTLPVGVKASLNADNGVLSLLEPGVV
jgi:muramoyltetrapeptide carboxypeptidase